jgi:tRNA threonylcarbamoyl adenosine modification protein YjeE
MNAPATFSVALANEAATGQLMADLALLISPGDLITLSGDLGAGKTAAARAMIRYLADDEALEVPSPTFTLAQSYDLPSLPLVHADLYRISDPYELEEIAGRPHRHRLQPSPGARLDRARGRDHRLWQDCRRGGAAQDAAAIPRRRKLHRRAAQAHGGRRLDPLLRAAAAG